MDKKHQHDNTHEHDHKHGDTEHTHEHDHSKEHGHNEGSHGHKHGGCCGQHGKDDEACCKNSEKQAHVHGDHHHHDHSHDGHHHHHDHEGHDHDEEPITLDLILDDGKEVKCEVVGIFEVEGKEYIALLPFDDDRVLLYTYEEVDDELNLENIEDDEEFKKVSETFWEIFGDDDFEKVDEE